MANWHARMEDTAPLLSSSVKPSYWKGKKVLITGHTGFKGSWLTIVLNSLGCEVIGVGLEPETNPSLFKTAAVSKLCDSHLFDICDTRSLTDLLCRKRPEVVFHLAAQAIVGASYETPMRTFSTNVLGTASILESIRDVETVKVAVIITSDKVYEPNQLRRPYQEEDKLGGVDPYSASKAAAELIVASYRDSFLERTGLCVATARAGNVIGGGDWAAARLIPDAIRAWSESSCLYLRNPSAVRPWQHVLEPLFGYVVLAEKINSGQATSGAYNFGPAISDCWSVKSIVDFASGLWPGSKVELVSNYSERVETDWLKVDSTKSRRQLGFFNVWDIEETVERTVGWYRKAFNGADTLGLCMEDIASYIDKKSSVNRE